MYVKIIGNDIKKSKLMTFVTTAFVTVAAMLVSLAMVMMTALYGAMNTMMDQAKPPHFLQMHAGEIDMDQARLEEFAGQNTLVKEFQVLEYLNLDSSEMVFGENSLAESLQDHGLCVQSEQFDFLLDLDGNRIKAAHDEIYVPVGYMKDGTISLGDRAEIHGKEFTVAGFLRDAQMNSTLASSKRFLVSEGEYMGLRDRGTVEYLIEFRLRDSSGAGLDEFEAAYGHMELPSNGPTITYPIFQITNAFTDGIVIAAILLISILVLVIAFLCIRFTVIAKIQDDAREIGTMKAIGMRLWDMKRIYLAKYMLIAGIGGLCGFGLSFVFRGSLLENIRLFLGESKNADLGNLLAVVGVGMVFAAVTLHVNKVLEYFRKISPAEAIRFGTVPEKTKTGKGFTLSKNNIFDANSFLGLKEVLSRKKRYIPVLATFMISVLMITVPMNLYHTISSRDFAGYMGIGDCDLRVDIQQTDNIAEKAREIASVMRQDANISDYAILTTHGFTARNEDGAIQRIRVELGDHTIFPVSYSSGFAPTKEDEIALSAMNADAYGKKVGDTMWMTVNGREAPFTVCGIYSDITNGGKTAKAAWHSDASGIMWHVICAKVTDKAQIDHQVSKYARQFRFAKISNIQSHMNQQLGTTLRAVQLAAHMGILIAVFVSLLITLLFVKMLISKDRYGIAVMKAMGFRSRDIKRQYMVRFILLFMIGLVLGLLFANTLGEALAGMLVSSFGIQSFQFTGGVWFGYLVCPLVMGMSVLCAVFIGTKGITRISISENIKE